MLEKGNIDNPTGNLILYAKVIGENPFEPDHEYIASNVVVSFLKINNSLPVVTFPPVSFRTLEDLHKAIQVNSEAYDIARLPDFVLPSEKEKISKYLQERMDNFNAFIARYVERCKQKEENSSQRIFENDFQGYFKELLETSVMYKNSSGLTKEIAKTRVDNLISEISLKFPTLDVENYKNAIFKYSGNVGDELATLYLKKFQAIYQENYEIASQIKKRIQELEANPN